MTKKIVELISNELKTKKRLLINAEGYVLGRLLSRLNNLKKPVIVENVDKLLITGKPQATIEKYRLRINSGTKHHGPFISVVPDKLVKRIFRGMSNYRSKGLYENCYFITGTLDEEKKIYYKEISKRIVLGPHMTVGELCKNLKNRNGTN